MGVYLAMTELELRRCSQPPAPCAWMACHFSSGDSGLSNMPDMLPEQSLLCIDDSLIPQGHDSQRIAQQVLDLYDRFSLSGVVLDFQRPYFSELETIAREIQKAVPCPVAVTEAYADGWEGAVFLPPVPLNQPLDIYFAPWKGRDLWLELDCQRLCMVLSGDGCTCHLSEDALPEPIFQDDGLHCRYHTALSEDAVVFTLERTWEDLLALTEDGRQYGVSNAVGLYQEIGSICPHPYIE